MKNLAILTVLMAFTLDAYSQRSFTEKTFYDLYAEYENDPKVFWEKTDENFVFIMGNGGKMSRTDLIASPSNMTVKNEYSDLTVNQSGSTALVSGIIDQTIIQKKDPSNTRKYKGVFTAVWAYQKKKWVLMSWQHSDYRPNSQ